MPRIALTFRALAVACLLAPAGCALVDPHHVMGRQIVDPTVTPVDVVPYNGARPLAAEMREEAFDFVWTTIRDRYHDRSLNGVDWQAVGQRYRPIAMAAPDDEAFWDELDRMAGELKDSHTRVESPRRVELRRRDESVTLGFSFVPLEGRLAVTAVHPDSDAWWAGVRPGMTLEEIGGERAAEVYRRLLDETRLSSTDRARHMSALRRLLTGDLGSGLRLAFERADGSRITGQFTRRRIATRPTASHRTLPSGYGYLRLSQWTLGVMPAVMRGMDALKDAPGLIIDVRGNPGGSVHAVNALLSRFFAEKTDLGNTTTRTGQPVSMFFGTVEIIKLKQEVGGRRDAYRGPVVILTNAGSGSGSELFAGTMQAVGRATVVGQPSCGCLLGFLGYARVPGGAELAYSEVGFVMANGRRIEGVGVLPDRPVPLTLADLRAGRDRALEEAQSFLATRLAAQ